jgi:outer membrane protein
MKKFTTIFDKKNMFEQLIINCLKCCFCVACFFTNINAQNKLTLQEAIKVGLNNNYTLKTNTELQNIAQLNADKGANAHLPRISAFLQNGNTINSVLNPTTFASGFYTNLGLTGGANLNWQLYDGNINNLQRKIFSEKFQQTLTTTTAIREQLIEDIVSTYFRAVVEKEKKEVLHQAVALSKARKTDALIQQQLGKMSVFDVLRAETIAAQDSAAVLQQVSTYELSLRQLSKALGELKYVAYILVSKLTYTTKGFTLESIKQKINSNNSLLQQSRSQITERQHVVNLQKAAYKPKLSFGADLLQNFSATQFKDKPVQNGRNFNLSGNFSLNVPLYNGGETARAVEEASLQTKIAENELEKVRQDLFAEAEIAIQTYHTQLKIIQQYDLVLQKSEKTLELAQDRFKNGLTTSFEFRQIQMEYLQAKLVRLEALSYLKKAETQIAKLSGELK